MDYTVYRILQARILEWVAFPFPGDLPNLGSNPGLPHCRWILYQLSHKGNPRILEWVASLSLLQQVFLTQESNQGLLHCRQILYQLGYQSTINIHISFPFYSPQSHLSRLSQSTKLSSLCCTAVSHKLSISHMVMYICQCYSLSLSHPLLPLLCPEVHSLYLHLYSCLANRFMSTIFLDTIYVC